MNKRFMVVYWKAYVIINLLKSNIRKAKRALTIARLVWDMRKTSDNAIFLALVKFYCGKAPLANHADFYLTQLLKDTAVKTEITNGKVTITFTEAK